MARNADFACSLSKVHNNTYFNQTNYVAIGKKAIKLQVADNEPKKPKAKYPRRKGQIWPVESRTINSLEISFCHIHLTNNFVVDFLWKFFKI